MSVSVCPRASPRGAMRRHMAIIRAHPRWSGRSHWPQVHDRLSWCIALHRRRHGLHPVSTALLRAPVVDPGADLLVKPTRGAPLATGIALPCIGHRFLDPGVVIASSRQRMSVPSIVGDGVSSVPQPKFPEEACHPRLGKTPDTQWPFGSPKFDVAVRPVIQPKLEPRRRGRRRGGLASCY